MRLEVIQASDLPKPDTGYFKPWSLEMLYQVEPELEAIAARTVAQKRRRIRNRLDAYTEAKDAADMLLGWGARDPRLRSSKAWDCFFDYILDQLNI